MTQVKTCGLTTVAAVQSASNAGAHYLGFIHFPPSPRHLSLAHIEAIAPVAGRAKNVLVVVDPDDALASAAADMNAIDFLQLHGSESVERTRVLGQLSQRPIIKAISVRSADDVAAAQAYLPHVHALLFDAKPPASGDWLPGGNGLSFDWTMLDQEWLKDQFWFLSGGLTPENVAQAIQLTRAPAVDVSSGIEKAPGEKDEDKIVAFLAAAKGKTHGT